MLPFYLARDTVFVFCFFVFSLKPKLELGTVAHIKATFGRLRQEDCYEFEASFG